MEHMYFKYIPIIIFYMKKENIYPIFQIATLITLDKGNKFLYNS